MSEPDTADSLYLARLCDELLAAGWDAIVSDLAGEVAARRDDAPGRGAWSLVIDRSGRWRFTATVETAIADGRELLRSGHTFRLLKQQQQVLTVAGRFDSQEQLPGLLAELTQLALEESGQPSHTAEGNATWPEEQATRAELIDL